MKARLNELQKSRPALLGHDRASVANAAARLSEPGLRALVTDLRAELGSTKLPGATLALELPVTADEVFTAEGPPTLDGYYGRLLRRTKDHDFEKPSADAGRRTAFVMNAEGLRQLRDDNATGDTKQQLKKTTAAGNRFELALIPPGSARVVPATWPNVLKLVGEAHADHLPNLKAAFDTHAEGLTKTSFANIEKVAGYRFAQVAPDDARFMTAERFAALKNPTLVQVRAFLFHTEHLHELSD